MKNRILFFLVPFMVLTSVFAQETFVSPSNNNEIGFFSGISSHSKNPYWSSIFHDYTFYPKDIIYAPYYGLFYKYHINPFFAIGVTADYCRVIYDYKPITEDFKIHSSKDLFCFLVTTSITYYQHHYFSLYSNFKFGFSHSSFSPQLPNLFLQPDTWKVQLQVDLLGIRVGKKHAVIAEFSVGLQEIVKVGYSYKF